jgi:diguanylate cyclase (GGDEF)-like protein
LTDLLTGLPNARSLRLQFEKTASQAHHYGIEFAILMMDLDGFKIVNDTLGHKVGDQALREVGHVLLSHIRSTDFLSRYAGDEFVAILQVNSSEISDLVKRLQETIDQHQYSFREVGVPFGVSIGWACYDVDGNTLDELLLAADRSMYANKFKRKAAFAEANYATASGSLAYPVM